MSSNYSGASNFSWYAIPPNVSDSGPDTRSAEPPPDFGELCIFAEDECRDARRIYRDDPTVQRKLRREALQRAQDRIVEALWMLGAAK